MIYCPQFAKWYLDNISWKIYISVFNSQTVSNCCIITDIVGTADIKLLHESNFTARQPPHIIHLI